MKSRLQNLLRDATHAQHVAINRHPLIDGLTRPGFPLANYLALLRSYAALYPAIELNIDQWLKHKSTSFSYSRRQKLPWLLEDLAYFQVFPFSTLKPDVVIINSWGDLVGKLYAIEGASLGGQIISQSLQAHLGLEKQSGARFFYGYGEATRQMWDEFLSFGASVVTGQQALDDAQHAAQTCFTLFQQALDDAQCHLAANTPATSAISR